MTTHSSILAWRTPWTEEPGGLHSMESQRVGHNWATKHAAGTWEEGFKGCTAVKNPPANAGGLGLILGLGRSPRKGNGNLLQYSCLENPMDRGAWWATVHVAATSGSGLSVHACTCDDHKTYHLYWDSFAYKRETVNNFPGATGIHKIVKDKP